MDRSFLAFKQLLLRLINGPDDPKLAPTPISRPRMAPRQAEADVRSDWTRVEF